MENASKALLIAGSVLVAILLIAFGVRTFNSTRGTTESVEQTMSATEIAQFNNKFAGYTGNDVPAAKVKALANMIIANNAKSPNKVTLVLESGGAETSYAYDSNNPNVSAKNLQDAVGTLSGTFDVSVNQMSADGLILAIKVKS